MVAQRHPLPGGGVWGDVPGVGAGPGGIPTDLKGEGSRGSP